MCSSHVTCTGTFCLPLAERSFFLDLHVMVVVVDTVYVIQVFFRKKNNHRLEDLLRTCR